MYRFFTCVDKPLVSVPITCRAAISAVVASHRTREGQSIFALAKPLVHRFIHNAPGIILEGPAIVTLTAAQRATARSSRGFIYLRPMCIHQLEPMRMTNSPTVLFEVVPPSAHHHALLKHSEALLLSPFFVSFRFHHLFALK